MTIRSGQCILVPVLGGDISAATLARARTALRAPGSRLVILHVVPRAAGTYPVRRHARSAALAPRWRRLASTAPVFVDAVAGDPAEVILSQAARFHSDRVLLDRPAASAPESGWVNDVIARVQRAAPERVTVLAHRRPRIRNGRLRAGHRPRPKLAEAPC